MSLEAGTRIGPYEVLEPLGAGGMGLVWKARDTRLLRDVAIKVLPDGFATDPERLARFERESQILAALNHPRIATVYGTEDTPSGRALVMELITGPTLGARIAAGPIPVGEALRTARDIADALEVAHEQGIVHRDLKPENLKFTSEGRVKVLDFGVAVAGVPAAQLDLAQSPTVTGTRPTGTLIGTVAYMSPEQVRGAAVDRRTDIWAFGCVLYELLTGQRAFGGESASDMLAAILRADPDWAALPAETPTTVRQLLERCLRKDPRQRLRDIGDARLVLDEVLAGGDIAATGPVGAPQVRHTWRVHAAWAVAALALAALGAWSGWQARAPSGTGRLRKLEVTIHNPLIDTWTRPRLSPDGQAIAYGASGRLWIRRLDRLEPLEIHGAEHAEAPFWSYDGRALAFASRRKLWRVGADGGEPVPVCDLPATGRVIAGAWRPDDVIVFSAWQESVYTVPASGGDPRVLLAVDPRTETDFHELSLLPDGRSLLFVPHSGTVDLSRIDVLRDGRRTVVVPAQQGARFDNPRYAPTGHLVYERSGSNDGVWAAPFDADRLEMTGEPFRVMAGARNPGVARDGTLMYTLARGTYQLGWVDRRGVRLAAVGSPQWGLMHPALSPDGTRVAVSATDEGGGRPDIWTYEIATGRRQPLHPAPTPTSDVLPAWSADGRWIAYVQQYRVPAMTVVARAPQSDGAQDLAAGSGGISLSLDGRTLVFTRPGERTGLDLWHASLAGDRWTVTPEPFLRSAANEAAPRLSPDGRFLAYFSDETGQNEVCLRRFPTGDERWTVSNAGGSHPVWNGTGTELFYRALDGSIMAVPVSLGESVKVGEPRALVDETTAGAETSRGWDVAPDGQRFLVVSRADEAGSSRVILVQNWMAEFERRKLEARSQK